ncbi:hypothetical protein M23134_06290 [Microscilla marina ATCC 23134]|uniref:Outer membrane protein beta-barrel domain-containing protein n=2 Tax=Microscilla marina TaxID=1027 RepID=A1ZYT9_MICM2|nr:hypothetical protein M23134_06290 [Microscilla marina ATCC 23134]
MFISNTQQSKRIKMKKITLSLWMVLFIIVTIQAQNQPTTLFGKKSGIKISGFGGPSISMSMLDGAGTLNMGGGGGVLLGNFFIGGYGSSTVTPNVKRMVNNENLRLKLVQGGIWTGYSFNPSRALHITTSLKAGLGALRLYQSNSNFVFTNYHNDDHSVRSEWVGTLLPELGIELNMTHFFRIALTGGYQVGFYDNAVKTDMGSKIDLNGVVGAVTFKFGWFR